MMALTLVNTNKVHDEMVGDMTMEHYKIEDYDVRATTYQNGFVSVDVTKGNKDVYLPLIRCNVDMKGNLLGFDIQTTSYGILPVEETKKMVASIEKAIAVAEILTNKFVK